MEPKKPDDYQKLLDLMGPYYAKLQESSGRKRRNKQRASFAIALFFGIVIGALATVYVGSLPSV